jgi:hypothetical protein
MLIGNSSPSANTNASERESVGRLCLPRRSNPKAGETARLQWRLTQTPYNFLSPRRIALNAKFFPTSTS